ncbi:MAG: DUF362 domain-containing protein [Halobacteriota archaeon]
MTSTVYFARLKAGSVDESAATRVSKLFDEAQFGTLIEADALTAIKLHVGERGNDSHLRPEFVRQVVERVKASGGKPFVTDANTLYSGGRHNAVDHLATALEHGFDYAVLGAPVIISDGLVSDHYQDVQIDKKHFETVKIAGDIVSAQSLIVMTHFKAHALAGFGGAIKNLGMGCAPSAGKADQHKGMSPIVDMQWCIACGVCLEVCPQSAITIEGGAVRIDYNLCVGCGECIPTCRTSSIGLDWKRDLPQFMEMLTEYAFGATVGKHGVGYLNFLLQITPDCDCVPWSDAPIVPDIGILASTDPVAIDAASLDLVNQQQGLPGTRLINNLEPGHDKFKGVWGETQGSIQITYGEEIGLGTSSYELVEL